MLVPASEESARSRKYTVGVSVGDQTDVSERQATCNTHLGLSYDDVKRSCLPPTALDGWIKGVDSDAGMVWK